MMLKSGRNMAISVLTVFSIFCVLSYLFPYTGDDWAWGSSIGLERLRTFFAGYNGRYFGNLLELMVTRSILLNVMIKAAALTIACWLSWKYSGGESTLSFGFAFMLLILIPKSLLRESIVWTAGFSNYVPPALLSVVALFGISKNMEKPMGWDIPAWAAVAAGFAGALFIENITIFNILLIISVLACRWIRQHRFLRNETGFLLGAVLGAAAMFSNSAYGRVATGTDYYRTVTKTPEDTLQRIYQNATQMMDYLIFENSWFCLIVTIILLLLAADRVKKQPNGKKSLWIVLTSAANVGLLVVVFFDYLCSYVLPFVPGRLMLVQHIVHTLRIVVAGGYVVSVAILICLCVPEEKRFRALLALLCVPVSLAPMLLVQPFGPRCVFVGYLMMMVCTVELFTCLKASAWNSPHTRRMTVVMTAAVTAIILTAHCAVFIPVHYWDRQRNDFAKFQSDRGSDTVYLCELPNESYLHNSTPDEGNLPERYILFHGLREDITLEFVSREELAKMIEMQMPG